jgi:YHS domain-containing protein
MQLQTILYFLLSAGVIFLMMRVGCGAHVMGHGHHRGHSGSNGRDDVPRRDLPPDRVTDPVCGMTIQAKDAKTAMHQGTIYYFCSQDCRTKFEATPERYLKGTGNAQHGMEHGHDVH